MSKTSNKLVMNTEHIFCGTIEIKFNKLILFDSVYVFIIRLILTSNTREPCDGNNGRIMNY